MAYLSVSQRSQVDERVRAWFLPVGVGLDTRGGRESTLEAGDEGVSGMLSALSPRKLESVELESAIVCITAR